MIKIGRDRLKVGKEYGSQLFRSPFFSSEDHDAGRVGARSGKQLTKVGISGDQDPSGRTRRFHNDGVRFAGYPTVGHMNRIVARFDKELREAKRDALVDQEFHALSRTGSSRSSTARVA